MADIDLSNPNRLLTLDEFCQWAGVSERAVRYWISAGTAPRRIKIGRGIRIKATDALAWAESRAVED